MLDLGEDSIFGFENCRFFRFMLGSHYLEANSLADFSNPHLGGA